MGSIKLPEAGAIYLDTQVLIYSVELRDRYWDLIKPIWEETRNGKLNLLTSELTMMEALVGPYKNQDQRLEVAYEEIFNSSEVGLVPISQNVLRTAARLRAEYKSLRTPDAIHAASARLNGCSLFITNDNDYRQIRNFPCLILDDIT